MENEEQHSRIRRNRLNNLHRKIKENPEVADFYSNTISSFLTVVALAATIIFSLNSLNNANKQLVLAQQQFQNAKVLHAEDSMTSAIKDKIANDRFIRDTTKQGERERSQETRNQLQDAANKQQFKLNKNQLKAIQAQAKIAEEQFYQQKEQYQQQQYEQRPIFNIDSVGIVEVNGTKSTIQFYLSNKGIRSAHIDSTVLAFYNIPQLCFSVTSNITNLDLVPLKNEIYTQPINIYRDCLKSPFTIYYLLIYYKDKNTGTNQIEPMFFRYDNSKKDHFGWFRVRGAAKSEFIKKLKLKGILVIE